MWWWSFRTEGSGEQEDRVERPVGDRPRGGHRSRLAVVQWRIPPGFGLTAHDDSRGPVHDAAVHLHRRKRGGRPRGLCAQRGHRGLPDHASLADGRACRRLGRGGAPEPVGAHARRRGDAVGGGGRGGAARGVAEGRTGDDVHRQPGPVVDGPQHVQDRGRADAVRDPRRRAHRRHPRTVHLRRSLGRDARPHHRLGDAGGQLGAGGPRLRAGEPRGDAAGSSSVPALLRRVPHQP